MLIDQKVKKFTELVPCTFAVYDCMQLEDVSMVTEILSQVFIRCCRFRHFSSIIKKCGATGIWYT